MSNLSQSVSIHPYFKIHPGQQDQFEALMADFVEKTSTESGCLYYDFSICGDQAYCRESYQDAAAILQHLENVGSCLGRAVELAELYRLEFHGPAEQIDQLREPLAHLDPDFYVHVTGVAH